MEIDLVGYEAANAVGAHCYTLTVTDIATGWTENRRMRNEPSKWVVAALRSIASMMPFPSRLLTPTFNLGGAASEPVSRPGMMIGGLIANF